MSRHNVIVGVLLLLVFLLLASVYLNRRGFFVSEHHDRVNRDSSSAVLKVATPEADVRLAKPVKPASPEVLDARIQRMPDARSSICRNKRYETSNVLVSIIIDFFDYQFHDLKMTINSVLANTADELIGEIIIVDDGSTLDYIMEESKLYVAGIKKAHLVRNNQRRGATRARQRGVLVSKELVLIFLDATVICNKGWLPPLLDALFAEPTLIAVPHYDNINDPVSYEYSQTSHFLVATFSWSLQVRMSVPPIRTPSQVSEAEARDSPSLRGNAFAITRKYFSKLDGYDTGLRDAGGEHLELSLRVWMCGGYVRVLPCSRVGVLNLKDPVRVGSAANAWRIAELWLQPMRPVIYRQTGANITGSPKWKGEVTARRQALAGLGCSSFESYKKGVGRVIYTPAIDTTYYGLLRVRNGNCAFASSSSDNRIDIGPCTLNYTSERNSHGVFEFHNNGAITVGNLCLTATNHAYVQTLRCVAGENRQFWMYDEGKGRLKNDWSGFCMMHVTDPDKKTDGKRQVVMVQDCDSDRSKDQAFVRWEFTRL